MSAAAERTLADARRAFVACESLFRAGLHPECHAFMLRALRSSLAPWRPATALAAGTPSDDAAPTAQNTPEASDQEAELTALAGAGYPDLERLRRALALTETTMPADFDWVWAEAERLYRFSLRRLAPERTRRRRRIAFGAGLAAIAILAIVFAARLWGRWRVTASATLSTDFAAALVADGNDATEWMPPDGQNAWVEIRLPRPRHVNQVRVYNGHNRMYVDRGTGKFKVTLFAGERERASAEGHFDRISDQIAKFDVPVEADGVTRVRVEVLTFLGRGAAIGEIELR